MKKVVLEGRRADVSWGHLSVDGIEHATEIFGKAVWDTNDAAVMDPNLIVRITVEATWRPVVAGSIWKGKHDGLERVVLAIEGGGLKLRARPMSSPSASAWCSRRADSSAAWLLSSARPTT